LRFETARQIDRRPLQLLCLILLGTLWPLHGYIASAGIVACALCLVWRGILRFPPPHLIARLGVIAAGMAAVYAEYGTLSGTEPGIAALLVFTGAKVLESRTPREFQVLALIGWFLAFCSILLENHLSRSLGAVLLILLIAGALVRFRRSSGGLAVPARVTGTLLAQALPLALVLFLVFPRGLLDIGSALGRSRFGQSGIDGTLDPGSIATLALRSNVAFRARFPDGEPPTNDKRYWRCLTLWHCDGLRWRQGERLGYRLAPGASDRSQQVRQVIDLEPHGKRWIPALDRPVSAEVRGMKMAPDFDDTLTSPIQVRNSERIVITSSFEVKRRGDLLESHREAALQLPATASPRLQQLVDSWTSLAQNDEQIVQLALNHLRNQGYSYTLEPGEYLGPGALEEFFLERKTGFCEHFSAAFATLMRMAGVPSRVVVGYLGGEYSEHNGGYLIIKQSDVHAWTEVWVERYGWYPIDPTAALAPDRVNIDLRAFLEGGAEAAERQRRSFWWRSSQRLRLWWDSVSYAWQDQVIDYDQETQRSLLERLGLNLSTRSGKITLLIASAAVALFGALLVTLWLRRPARVRDPWLRHWRRVCQRLARAGLRRCGLAEGPLAYAQYVAASRPDLAAPILALADMYIHGRYGTSDALAAFRQAASQLPIRSRPR
jgi:transglutaminase-like putative cysteine protease